MGPGTIFSASAINYGWAPGPPCPTCVRERGEAWNRGYTLWKRTPSEYPVCLVLYDVNLKT